MKQFIISCILSIFCFICGSAQTVKYGVVDVDSVLISIPGFRLLNQQLDSVRVSTLSALAPLQEQMRDFEEKIGLLSPNDTLEYRKINEDAQLVYQEMNLIQQKGSRAMRKIIESGKIYSDSVNTAIKNKATELKLELVMPKTMSPVYDSFGNEILYLNCPLYYSGEAIDITEMVIESLGLPKQNMTNTNTQKKRPK